MKFDEYARRSGRAVSEAGKSAMPPPLDHTRRIRRQQRLLIPILLVGIAGLFAAIALLIDAPTDDGRTGANSTLPGTRQLVPPTTFYPSAPPGVLIDPPCVDMGDCAFGFVLGQGHFYEVTCTPARESSLSSDVLAQGSLSSLAVTVKELIGVDHELMVAIDNQGAGQCSSGGAADWVLALGPGRSDDQPAFSAALCRVGELSEAQSLSNGCDTDEPGDVRVAGIPGGAMRLTYPADWYLADQNLTPNLGAPREVFSLGSFPLSPGGPNCANIPSRALHDLGSTDVFLTVQERTVADPAGFDPRPEHFGPTPGDTDNVIYHCIDPSELNDIDTLHWFSFSDQDRYFHVLVAIGADASGERVTQLWSTLDRLVIQPAGNAVSDPHECIARDEGSPLNVAGEPDWRRHADYTPWTDSIGCLVRIDVLAERPGPDHCDWEETRVMITGDPFGSRYTDASTSVAYVRDPGGAYGVPAFVEGFQSLSELPADAQDSGYRNGSRELWFSQSDQSAVFIRSDDSVERWPRGEVPGCL